MLAHRMRASRYAFALHVIAGDMTLHEIAHLVSNTTARKVAAMVRFRVSRIISNFPSPL